MEEVKKLQAEGDEYGVKRAKENIIRKLKRLHGDTAGTIKAMRSDVGEVRMDTMGMIEIMQKHWAEVFEGRGVDNEMMERWLEQTYPQSIGRDQERKRDAEGRRNWRQGLPPENSGRWEVRKGDLARAIKQSKNSALGPDGLPHKVWRELGEFGVDILWGA
eukprot:16434971-Heterocapsa_arctica.AAC.1